MTTALEFSNAFGRICGIAFAPDPRVRAAQDAYVYGDIDVAELEQLLDEALLPLVARGQNHYQVIPTVTDG